MVYGLLGPLAWGAMRELFGEDTVKHRVEELTRTRDRSGGISLDERTRLASEAAQRYVAGWRPTGSEIKPTLSTDLAII